MSSSLELPSKVKQELESDTNDYHEALTAIQNFELDDQEGLEIAKEAIHEVKNKWKELEDKRKEYTSPLVKLQRLINADFKPAQDALKQMESTWKKKVSDYQLKIEEERQRLLVEAKKAQAKGNLKKVQAAMTQMAETDADMEGVSFREKWTYTITQPKKLPREFTIPDERKIAAYVREHKDKTKIIGVKVFKEKVVVAR